MIVIIDYGVGNIGSIVSMLNKIGVESVVSSSVIDIQNASKLILPGVGAFDKAMSELNNRGIIQSLCKAVIGDKKPILGICLGAQILGNSSEEGKMAGLKWIDMDVKRFSNTSFRVPHMGWNFVKPIRNSILFDASDVQEQRFYFVHSFYMSCKCREDILAISSYGDDFVCAVNRENIYGVQFHPEKSHKFGFNLLKRFVYA
ncbi:MAG TPA: imidazole glycerol phosphate synthase subunit HisH [Coxiellaceae bacterium]|nr:imidazole glycerol phosphate synthase subunit HisH [Coxiellaceae bacterium]